MEFTDVLKRRVSTREYNGKEIEEEKLLKILAAMQLAPTAMHAQSYKFYLKKGQKEIYEIIEEVSGQGERVRGADALIIFFADIKTCEEIFGDDCKDIYSLQDATLAAAYAQLTACDQGLATLWIGAFDEAKVKKICKTEDYLKPVAIIIFGYSDLSPLRPKRRDLNELKIQVP